uniref:Uncharacterized protein n=1 Tax=viral metagenome TaxID=1070528 RepID=A0A6C0HCN3_9ZZZZ
MVEEKSKTILFANNINMNNEIISTNIQPFEQITTKTITSFRVSIDTIILFTSANIVVDFYDNNNILIDRKRLTISGDDYTNWGNSDEYIINYVANYYNFIIIPNTNSV